MNSTVQYRVSLLLFSLLMPLASCSGSSSTPGSADVEKALGEQLTTRECANEMKLIGVKKINGWEEKEMSRYGIEFSSEIEVLKDAPSVKYCYNGDVGFMDLSGHQKLKRGERATVTGKMLFKNTENGWKVAAIRIDGGGP